MARDGNFSTVCMLGYRCISNGREATGTILCRTRFIFSIESRRWSIPWAIRLPNSWYCFLARLQTQTCVHIIHIFPCLYPMLNQLSFHMRCRGPLLTVCIAFRHRNILLHTPSLFCCIGSKHLHTLCHLRWITTSLRKNANWHVLKGNVPKVRHMMIPYCTVQ